jgi:ferredoxin
MHHVTVEGEGTFEVEPGTRLVRALKANGIDVSHRCGGHAQCTTCRVDFSEGEPDVMTSAEYDKLRDIDRHGDFRLSCQIVVDRDMTVRPLMRVRDQNWDDPGPEVAVAVEPEAEWSPMKSLADAGASDSGASDSGA